MEMLVAIYSIPTTLEGLRHGCESPHWLGKYVGGNINALFSEESAGKFWAEHLVPIILFYASTNIPFHAANANELKVVNDPRANYESALVDCLDPQRYKLAVLSNQNQSKTVDEPFKVFRENFNSWNDTPPG